MGDEDGRSDASFSDTNRTDRDSDGGEYFALSKEEASKFHGAMKTFSETCVKNGEACTKAANDARDSCAVSKAIEARVDNVRSECEKTLQCCEKACETARFCMAETKSKETDMSCLYDKVLLSAANGEDMSRASLTILSTATDVLFANGEIVHAVRKAIGEVKLPFKLKADMKQVGTNLERLKQVCKGKKKIVNNMVEVSSLSRKVAAMDALLEEEIEIMRANVSDYESDDRFTPETEDNPQNPSTSNKYATATPTAVKIEGKRRAEFAASLRKQVKKQRLAEQAKDGMGAQSQSASGTKVRSTTAAGDVEDVICVDSPSTSNAERTGCSTAKPGTSAANSGTEKSPAMNATATGQDNGRGQKNGDGWKQEKPCSVWD